MGSGMTAIQLGLIEAIAKNDQKEIKKLAIACCNADDTKKNQIQVQYLKNLLKKQPTLLELPTNISHIVTLQDMSDFREDRYYLSERENVLCEQIIKMHKVSIKLMELGIPYLNSTLLTGISGTGKTTFGKYMAYKLKLPFLYVNFSFLIESRMGKTSSNIHNIFSFAKANACVLMLDEIDCIATKRQSSGDSAGREFNNTTISLLQELDQLGNDVVVIGATNVPELIDAAVKRRFSIVHEVEVLDEKENAEMVQKYLSTVPCTVNDESIVTFVRSTEGKKISQGIVMNRIIQCIADSLMESNF